MNRLIGSTSKMENPVIIYLDDEMEIIGFVCDFIECWHRQGRYSRFNESTKLITWCSWRASCNIGRTKNISCKHTNTIVEVFIRHDLTDPCQYSKLFAWKIVLVRLLVHRVATISIQMVLKSQSNNKHLPKKKLPWINIKYVFLSTSNQNSFLLFFGWTN